MTSRHGVHLDVSAQDEPHRMLCMPAGEAAFLADGGEMGALMRAHDWAATPLGLPEGWPASLQLALQLILNTRHPAFLYWGPHLICFYNDAYRVTMGPERHPSALGGLGRLVCSETWNTMGPQIERVMSGQGSTWNQEQLVPITRHGRREDVWWTYGVSPIRDEAAAAGVGGALVLCQDVTAQVLADRRRAFTSTLAQTLQEVGDVPAEAIAMGTRLLAEQLAAQRVSYVEVDEGVHHGRVAFTHTDTAHLRDLAGSKYVLDDFGSALIADLRAGCVLRIDDVEVDPRTAGEGARAHAAIGARAVLAAPLVREHCTVGFLAVNDVHPRAWTQADIDIVVDAAVQLRVAVERAQVIEALADSERRFRLLANTMPQIVWATRPDGYHDYFNERWYEYTAMPRPLKPGGEYDPSGTGQGWNWKDYLHPDDYERTAEVWSQCLATGEPYHIEYRFKRHDGQYRWFIGRALALRNEAGAIVRWFGTLTDIHDQKLTACERDALIGQLREADSRKNEFLAMLAHELRNPLAPITNAVRFIERKEALSEPGQRALEMVDRQARQMKRLVNDLLEVSRITRGTIELKREPMLLGAAVQNAVEAMLAAFDARSQTVEMIIAPRPLRLWADPVRIAQVLENLLNNASKYTPDGGHVCIDASDEGDDVELRVTDNGSGIDAEHLEAVFELFMQAEPGVGRHQGGLGIGLAMVKRLVELHGGSVAVSSPGKGLGATFTVRLPRGGPHQDI